jgi:hypothetical protein
MKNVLNVWKEAGEIVGRRPTVILPFLIACVVNLAAIFFLYLAPQRPVLTLLGPPIRTFFSEYYLHYPNNFILLPRLCNYAEIIIAGFFGMLMTAVGVGMIADVKRGVRASFFINLVRSLKRYFALFGIWLLTFGLIFGFSKLIPLIFKPAGGLAGFFIMIIYFFANILINLLFAYSIIAVIAKGMKFIPAIKKGIFLFFKFFLPTLFLAALPSLLYLPIVMLKSKTRFLIDNVFPEMVLIVLLIGAVLVAIIEFIIYLSLTVLYINKEGGNA